MDSLEFLTLLYENEIFMFSIGVLIEVSIIVWGYSVKLALRKSHSNMERVGTDG